MATRVGGRSVKPLPDRLRRRPETTSVDHFTVLVESAAMTPDVTKIDAGRQLNPGPSAWNFRDEVLRRFLHGNSLSLRENLLIPFPGTNPISPTSFYSNRTRATSS